MDSNDMIEKLERQGTDPRFDEMFEVEDPDFICSLKWEKQEGMSIWRHERLAIYLQPTESPAHLLYDGEIGRIVDSDRSAAYLRWRAAEYLKRDERRIAEEDWLDYNHYTYGLGHNRDPIPVGYPTPWEAEYTPEGINFMRKPNPWMLEHYLIPSEDMEYSAKGLRLKPLP